MMDIYVPSTQLLPARDPNTVWQEVGSGAYNLQQVLGDGCDIRGAEGILAQLNALPSASLY